ncbi:MAG: xanthine dehydrogenase family protein subunit M [Clostridia bacterium]|nr:xanthine dehydrogenase family protein subunit M [Candidatus Pelethousia sp.]NCB29956.1 xanthine dehydrogenase family protein subunit M [Clostridia bacterium]
MAHTNTKFMEKEFDYLKPNSLSEALGILADNKNVKIFAGGTDLIVKLKTGAPIEMDYMLDINAIEELKGMKPLAGGLAIGSAEKIAVLERDGDVQAKYPALFEAFKSMAAISIRNMATLGGNFCNASPVADAVGPVMCYQGSVALQSRDGGERLVAAEDFFLAPGVTVMQPQEMLTKIILPAPGKNTGAAFIKMGRVKSDIAKISITVVLEREGNAIANCRMAMGSVAARPLFLKDISQSLTGKEMSAALIQETAEQVSAFIRPIDDNRTTAQYRTDVAAIIVRDALTKAWQRSGGDTK